MAEYNIKKLPKRIVIRPSGIWDTRAPLHTYFTIQKGQQRAYDITILAHERVETDFSRFRDDGIELRSYLRIPNRGQSVRSWNSYERAWSRRNREGQVSKPSYGGARGDLWKARAFMRKAALLSALSLFEAYVNSWMLNFLLIKLEHSIDWTKFEEEFATKNSPVHSSGTSPSLARVLAAVGAIEQCLRGIPHDDGALQDRSESAPEFSAYDAIQFWRQYRNCVVHNGGFCTPRLFERNVDFWNIGMRQFSTKDVFEEREPLSLSHELLVSCKKTLNGSVVQLEKQLEFISLGRRGHPWAPADPLDEDQAPPKKAPPLLVCGDHRESFLWHTSEEYRSQFKL